MDNALILLLESSCNECSVTVAGRDGIVALRHTQEPRAHASKLALFIQEVLQELGIDASELCAVAVSSGPGSYTGLRVGVSTAKAIAWASKIPLIAVETTDILVQMGLDAVEGRENGRLLVVPMIDARRMEVYPALYDSNAARISEISLLILDGDSFNEEFASYDTLVFVGDGAEKFKPVLSEDKLAKSVFVNACPAACAMRKRAFERFDASRFEDYAYFEPFYLKDFVAGVSKKKLF